MMENIKFPLESGKEKPEIDWMEKIQKQQNGTKTENWVWHKCCGASL